MDEILVCFCPHAYFQENGMAFFMQAPYGSRWPSWLNDGLGQSWDRCKEQMLDLSTQMKKCDIKSPYSEEHMYILTNIFPMQWRLTDSLKKSLKVNCEELLKIYEWMSSTSSLHIKNHEDIYMGILLQTFVFKFEWFLYLISYLTTTQVLHFIPY